MTEIIALTVFLIALGKKSQSLDGNTPIGRLVSIATGGIIEELVEEGVEGILKLPELIFESISGMSDYFRKRKIIGAAVVSLIQAVENMSDKERETLSDFLCEAYEGSANDKEYKKFRKTYLKAQSELGKHRNDRKRLIKGFYKVVDSVVESFTEKMLEDFSYKDGGALAESYLGRRDIPAPVAETARIVCECMYELKYVSMADEDRDVIKLTQEIVSRNNEKMAEVLMDRLKGYFNLIIRQNSRVKLEKSDIAAIEAATEKKDDTKRGKIISKIVRNDASLWLELSCPSCGASGNLISREGDLVRCHLCDKSFALRDSTGDDILAVLDEMSEAMASGLSDIRGAADDIKGELTRLSYEILTSNKRLLESVIFHSDDLDKRSEAILSATGAACESIRAQVQEGRRELKDVLKRSTERILRDMKRGFEETKDTVVKEADRLVDRLKESEDRLASRLSEHSETVKEMSYAISSMHLSSAGDEVIRSHSEQGKRKESIPAPVASPKTKEVHKCDLCGGGGGECDEERHRLCGAMSDRSNVIFATLSGNGAERLSLVAEGVCEDADGAVVRVELGALPSDVSDESVYTVGFSSRAECLPARGALKKCRTAVIHSGRKIRLSSAFIQRFLELVGTGCAMIAFSEKITLPRGLKAGEWRLDAGKRALIRG
ncbi:MAG: hypothetical protein J6L90_05155 [Clostridia bacterium]|nr:hypothetical protein [Clostridia bacterium]